MIRGRLQTADCTAQHSAAYNYYNYTTSEKAANRKQEAVERSEDERPKATKEVRSKGSAKDSWTTNFEGIIPRVVNT